MVNICQDTFIRLSVRPFVVNKNNCFLIEFLTEMFLLHIFFVSYKELLYFFQYFSKTYGHQRAGMSFHNFRLV